MNPHRRRLAGSRPPHIIFTNPDGTETREIPAGEAGPPWYQSYFRIFMIIALSGSMLYLISPFITALLIGGIFAVVFLPTYEKLLARGWRRSFAALTLVLTFGIVVIVPTTFVILKGSKLTMDYLQDLSSDQQKIDQIEDTVRHALGGVGLKGSDSKRVLWYSVNQARDYGLQVFKDFLSSAPDILLQGVIVLGAIYFGLVESKRCRRLFLRYSALTRKKSEKFILAIRRTCRIVIFSNLATGCVQSLVMVTASVTTGTGDPFLVGFFTFICSFFPIIGTAPTTLVLCGLKVMEQDYTSAIIIFVAGVIASISDNIVRPWVIKDDNVHPFVAFVAVVGAVVVMGFPGLFLGPLIAGLFVNCLPIFLPDRRRQGSPVSPAISTSPAVPRESEDAPVLS